MLFQRVIMTRPLHILLGRQNGFTYHPFHPMHVVCVAIYGIWGGKRLRLTVTVCDGRMCQPFICS